MLHEFKVVLRSETVEKIKCECSKVIAPELNRLQFECLLTYHYASGDGNSSLCYLLHKHEVTAQKGYQGEPSTAVHEVLPTCQAHVPGAVLSSSH